jgi:hypothetical protein
VDDEPEYDVELVVGYTMMRHRPFYKVHW